MPGALGSMTHQDRNHYLVHREYHCGRSARSCEEVTDVGYVGDARSFATQLGRDHDAKQPLVSGHLKRLVRKPRLCVNRFRALQSCGSHRVGTRYQIVVSG